MHRRLKMRRIVKTLSASAAILSAMLFIMIGCCDASLPDSYFYDIEGTLSLSSYDYISVKSQGDDTAVLSSDSCERQLMLFDIIPIKTVSASSITPPELTAGGNPFGIKLEAGGAVVVDFYELDGRCPARECGLAEGDVILSCNGTEVYTNQSFADIIMQSGGEPIELVILRNGEQKTLKLSALLHEGTYKAGAEIRDSCAGIGTVSFYDCELSMFAGLGHAVCDNITGEIFPCKKGVVAPVEITGIRKSENGNPGELQGIFTNSKAIGSIAKNCESGVYGSVSGIPSGHSCYPLGFKQDITLGSASVICTLTDGEPQQYQITIEDINLTDDGTKNMVIRITDDRLLDEAGGIVQGMSGSPIIQNGKIIGAVTHVFVKDTQRGYAIFAENMYGELLSLHDDCETTDKLLSAS